jgi:hypothetical protein
MTMTSELTVLPDFSDLEVDLSLPLGVGAGAVDPELIEPHDTQEQLDTESLVASCCSYL